MRVVFLGTATFALPSLRGLVNAGHEVVAVYTSPPRPAGRGMVMGLSPVGQEATKLGLKIRYPKSLKGHESQRFSAFTPDVAVVAAYGLLLPSSILNIPVHGCLNVHGSLLPRWRGAAPIQRALIAGDSQTGVTIIHMTEGLDKGPIYLAKKVMVTASSTADQLHDLLADLGADLLIDTLNLIEAKTAVAIAQDDNLANYAHKITPKDGQIDWQRSALEIHNLIRGLSPSPGAWSEAYIKGKWHRIKMLKSEIIASDHPNTQGASGLPGQIVSSDNGVVIGTGNGDIRVLEVQRSGKKIMPAKEFLRGSDIRFGDFLRYS